MIKYLLSLSLAVLCSSCALNDTARLKSAKTCVITTSIPDEADFHRLGFTTFGNRHERSTIPGLRKMTEEVLREEIGRFYQIKAVVQAPPPGKEYNAAMASVRAKHQADLEIQVYPHGYHPYGIPAYLEADGFGLYTGGSAGGGTAVSYTGLRVLDGTTGKEVASPLGQNDYGIVPDADTFAKERMKRPSQRPFTLTEKSDGVGHASLSPGDRARLLGTYRELFREKVRNDLWRMELR